MGRILGKVENGMGQTQYLIHCDTAGVSYRPLFDDPDKAWAIYDASGSDGLYAAVPAQGRTIRVVRKSLAFGRSFGATGEICGEPQFGVATEDRLIGPTQRYGGDSDNYSLMRIDGVLHLAQYVDGGFMGNFHVPLCDEARPYTETDEVLSLGDFYGKPIVVCPHCVEAITAHWK